MRVPNTTINLDRNLWILFHFDLRRIVRVRRFADFLADELMKMRPLLQGELT